MKRLVTWIAFSLASVVALDAAEKPRAPLTPGHRYLFVLDTSLAMAHARETVAALVPQLILSGMNGQIQPGDEFTIWTCDEQVRTERFQPEMWLPELKQDLAGATATFLKEQRYENHCLIYMALVEMFKVVQVSRSVTVLLINDGTEPLQGTPFDLYANTIYRDHARQLRRAKKPFVTALLAVKGKIIACSVSAGGNTINLPQIPDEFLKVARPKPMQPAPPPAAARVTPAPTPPVTVAQTTPAPVKPPELQPASGASTAIMPPAAISPAPNEIAVPKEPGPTPPVTVTQITPAPVEQPEPQPASAAASARQPAPKKPQKKQANAKTVPAAKEAGSPPAKIISSAKETKTATGTKEKFPAEKKPAPQPAPPKPEQPAVGMLPEPGPRRGQLLLIGVALLVVAGGLGYLIVRSVRPSRKPSLISQSMHPDDK